MALLAHLSRGLAMTFGIGMLLITLPGNVAQPDSDMPNGQIMSGIVNVYVSGAVRKPGVYRFPVGTRTIQAIQQAGGLLPGTPADNLEMSRILDDGQSLHIDPKPTPLPSVPMLVDRLPVPATRGRAPAAPSGGPATPGLSAITLNLATVDMLDALPGIGRKRAEDIVRYRQQHGAFHSVNDLQRIRGMGPKLIARLRPLLRI